MYDLSIRAASIEEAIGFLGDAEEQLEGCGCEDDIFAIAETKEHLKIALSDILLEIAKERRETEEELTPRYYQER